jgi:hypothetical protein
MTIRYEKVEELADKVARGEEGEVLEDSHEEGELQEHPSLRERNQKMAAMEQARADEIALSNERLEAGNRAALEAAHQRQSDLDDEEWIREVEDEEATFDASDEDEWSDLAEELHDYYPEIFEDPVWKKRFVLRLHDALRGGERSDDKRTHFEVAKQVEAEMEEAEADLTAKLRYDNQYERLKIADASDRDKFESQASYDRAVQPNHLEIDENINPEALWTELCRKFGVPERADLGVFRNKVLFDLVRERAQKKIDELEAAGLPANRWKTYSEAYIEGDRELAVHELALERADGNVGLEVGPKAPK